MVKILLSLVLSFISVPAFAEEVVPETPSETSAPAPVETSAPAPTETSAPAPAYTPPPVASDGPGAWAVIDPETNIVHGAIWATVDTFIAHNGLMPFEYMGCKAGCLLRFQSPEGGYGGWGVDIDASGNAHYKNDGSVKWNSSDSSFDLNNTNTNNDGTVKAKKKLIPSKTKESNKGIVDVETKFESTPTNDRVVNVEVIQSTPTSPSSITVDYPAWNNFQYDSVESLSTNLDTDVETALVVEEESLATTIRLLTDKVKNFFSMIFGSNNG
jgi:hypothetical protein